MFRLRRWAAAGLARYQPAAAFVRADTASFRQNSGKKSCHCFASITRHGSSVRRLSEVSTIFAELQYHPYSDVHDPLVGLLSRHFQSIESRLQDDSYVWVFDNGHKVAVDTFTSMQHQAKNSEPSDLVNQVLKGIGA